MEEYVELSGARLWTVRGGRGPALVLLHGGPGGSFSGLHPVVAMLDDLAHVHGYGQRRAFVGGVDVDRGGVAGG